MKTLALATLAVMAPWLAIAALAFRNSNPPVASVCLLVAVLIVLLLATEIPNGNAR